MPRSSLVAWAFVWKKVKSIFQKLLQHLMCKLVDALNLMI